MFFRWTFLPHVLNRRSFLGGVCRHVEVGILQESARLVLTSLNDSSVCLLIWSWSRLKYEVYRIRAHHQHGINHQRYQRHLDQAMWNPRQLTLHTITPAFVDLNVGPAPSVNESKAHASFPMHPHTMLSGVNGLANIAVKLTGITSIRPSNH